MAATQHGPTPLLRTTAMTTPDERTRSLLHTHQFLQELTWSDVTPGVPDEVQAEARRLLRHFPRVMEVILAAMALPLHFPRVSLAPESPPPTRPGAYDDA